MNSISAVNNINCPSKFNKVHNTATKSIASSNPPILYGSSLNALSSQGQAMANISFKRHEFSSGTFMMSNLIGTISSANTTEAANARMMVLTKLCSDEKLYENYEFMGEAHFILQNTETYESGQAKCDAIDALVLNEGTPQEIIEEDPYTLMRIIADVNSPGDASFVKKCFEDEKFCKDPKLIRIALMSKQRMEKDGDDKWIDTLSFIINKKSINKNDKAKDNLIRIFLSSLNADEINKEVKAYLKNNKLPPEIKLLHSIFI